MAHSGDPRRPARVAIIQAKPVYMDRDATLAKVVRFLHEAADQGAEVTAFPESFVPGFPYWPRAFPLPQRGLSLDTLAVLRREAVDLASPQLDEVRAAARERGVTVALGVTEIGTSPSLLYNSLVYVGPDGEIAGVHRKLQMTFDEHCVWSNGDATGMHVIDTPAGNLGGLICGNNSITLAKAMLLLMGEDLHVAAWPGYRWMWPQTELVSRGYAMEGRVHVLVASSVLTADDVPVDHPLWDETQWDISGGSGIVGPDGQWLAGPVFDEEAVLIAEVDLGVADRYRAVRDAVDLYGRPDLFRLMVNTAPQRSRGARLDAEGLNDWQVFS